MQFVEGGSTRIVFVRIALAPVRAPSVLVAFGVWAVCEPCSRVYLASLSTLQRHRWRNTDPSRCWAF